METDDKAAVEWFQKAADQEYPRAMMLLGECYENGYGIEKDVTKAVELYTKAHEAGHPPATCSLGLCYEVGTGVELSLIHI